MKALSSTLGLFVVRLSAGILALGYLLAPVALIFAATPTPKPTCQIVVNPTSISIGGSVTVKWTSTNATAGAITNIGNVGPSGSYNTLPSSAAVTTYFGAFTGPGGTSNCQASVAVSSASSGGGSVTDVTQTNTPQALGVQTTLPASNGSSGLVPCGYGAYDASNSKTSSTGCQACDLAQLIQNIMTFAIGIAIPIAAALFAYAGVLMFTSAENPGRITKAKQIFKDAFIGFLIAITAWLVINTLLHVIFSQGTFSSGNWFTIECTSGQRQVNGKITDVLSKLPIVGGNAGAISSDGSTGGISTSGTQSGGTGSGSIGGDTSCNSGYTYDAASGSCYNPTIDDVQNPVSRSDSMQSSITDALTNNCSNGDQQSCNALDAGVGNKLTDAQQDALQDKCDDGDQTSCNALSSALAVDTVSGSNTDCSAGNIQAAAASGGYNLTDAQAATLSCIAVPESACGRNTSIATTPSGQVTSAAGMFQIVFGSGNDQCHNLNIDVCTQAAQAAGYNVSGNLNCYASVRGGQRLGSDACRAAAANVNCNASAAACLVSNNRSSNKFSDWTADSRSSAQAQCIQKFANG